MADAVQTPDADTDDSALQLDVTVEETGPASRAVTITIPAEAVDERIELSFAALQNEAQVPGFRKGRVPRQLLERRFGDAVVREAQGQLLADAYSQALERESLRTVGEPEMNEDSKGLELERGKPFTFGFSVEVVPSIDLPSLEGVAIRKPVMEVEESHVDAEIKRNRYRFGAPERIEGPFEPLDRMRANAVVDVEGRDDHFFESDQVVVVVPAEEDEGKGVVLGLLIESLSETLLGKKVGDTVTIETEGPESHESPELRGKKITITLELLEAERITPLDEETLATRFGLESVEMLHERIRHFLEARRDSEQRAAEREQVYEYLLENTKLELPPKLSESQVSRGIERQRLELIYQGLDEDEVERRLAEMRAESEESSRNRLKLFFILDEVARTFDVQVSDGEVNAQIVSMARQRGVRPEQLRQELVQANRLNEIAVQVREHKAADRVVDQAEVTEVPADEWNAEVRAKGSS